jgi:hypothetical protein
LYANGFIDGDDYDGFQKYVAGGLNSDSVSAVLWFLLLQEWRRQRVAIRDKTLMDTPWEELIDSARKYLLADLKSK